MTDTSTFGMSRSSIRGDATIAVLAWMSASAGVALVGRPLWVALVVLALPMAAFIATGFLAGRGGVMACLIAAIGVGILSATGGANPSSVVLLGVIVSAATCGGLVAERMTPAAKLAEPTQGRWMTIVVEYQGMADTIPTTSRRRAETVAERPSMARTG